jgi:molybdopterin-guanine dinucleotide biosynthesis protein A
MIEPMENTPDFLVVIQAGGQSSRMGQDKALMPFLGRPLIARQVERLRPLGAGVVVVTNRPDDYAFLNLPLIPDDAPGQGLLVGLRSALSALCAPLLAVVACDMPFLQPALLQVQRDLLLREDMDVVVPRSPHGLEPLHMVYRRAACLPAINAAIQAGERRPISWLPHVRTREMTVEEVAAIDPGFRSFINVNTPEEFRQAELMAQEEK